MPATEELLIRVRTDGLSDMRRLDLLLARIEARLERLKVLAEEAGIPFAALVESERESREASR